MSNISAIIIDDESSNRQLIRTLIERLDPQFQILGEASGIQDAYPMIEQLRPQVIFLDIKMQDGSGFDLLKMFRSIQFEVVFITGFDEYALKAFEYNALDYVLKPLNTSKFAETLKRVRERISNQFNYFANLEEMLRAYDAPLAIITKIPVHHKDRVVLLPLAEIQYVHSQEGCTHFHTVHEERYVSSKQLSDFDFIFEKFPNYLKINKSTYLNLDFVQSYTKGETCEVTMKDNTVHEISRRKKTLALEIINRALR